MTINKGVLPTTTTYFRIEQYASSQQKVLPIVGVDVGAIGFISLSALVQAEGTLLNSRINF
jgi:hypothetical protein